MNGAKVANSRLLIQQFYQAVNKADWDEARNLARKIMPLELRNRDLWENMAGVFIDGGCLVEGKQTLTFLEQHFAPNPARLMLKTKLAYLADDWELAITLGEKGLVANLPNWQKAVIYNCLAQIYIEINQTEKAVAYHRAASLLPDNPGALISYSNYLFYMHYCEYAPEVYVKAAKFYNIAFNQIVRYKHNYHQTRKKIRIGYLSADFYASVTTVFCYPFFQGYDKRNFEVYVYAKCSEDNISRDLAQYVDVWRNVATLEPDKIAALLYADQLDILFDPSGHNKENCLAVFAYKPAPVQVSGLGYIDTTGLAAMDYFVTDVYADPPGKSDNYFVEKLLRLPHSHFCYTYIGKPFTREIAPCLRKGCITFGTLNKFAKVTDKMLAVWRDILTRVPGSYLYLKGSAFDHAVPRKLAIKRLQQAGIDLGRVIMSGFDGDYMQAYNEIDIAFDTYPYPGGTTTCDALFAGVPVVTLAGDTHNRRFGYSLLKNLQLEDFVANSVEEYVDICVSLAKDKKRLVYLRQVIAAKFRISPIMNAGMYMADIEAAYRQILGCDAKTPLTEETVIYWMEQGEIGVQRLCYLLWQELETAEGLWRLKCLCYLADAASKNDNLQLKYRVLHKAVNLWKSLPLSEKAQLSIDWEANMQAGLGRAALALGYYAESAAAYGRQAQIATNNKDKFAAISSQILVAHFVENSANLLADGLRAYALEINKLVPLPAVYPIKRFDKKIRIGYLSPDFRNHALFPCIYALFAAHSKADFTVIGYQINENVDGFTKELRACADAWREVGKLTYREIAEQIRADGIDILVDLAGHSANSGLPVLGYRPAKIQMYGLGSLCRTGIDHVDYFITDNIVDPPDTAAVEVLGTEKPLCLPSQFAYVGRNDLPVSVGAPCLQRDFVQFAVFQRYSKINKEMLSAWKQILAAVPNSRLLIKNLDFINSEMVLMACEQWQKADLPMDRIDLEAGDDKYMERMLSVDIMLDTYPYTGGRTTMDALYMGVPVVTRYGMRRNTRFGLSILTNIGLSELAAANITEYVQRAVRLAEDVELLDVLHKELRRMMVNSVLSPTQYMYHLENSYRKLINA